MQSITTVTQKGQVTIPKAIRDVLYIKPYTNVIVERFKNYVKITPQRSLLNMFPIASAPRGKDALLAREFMEKNYSRV